MSNVKKPFADLFIESSGDIDLKFINESIRNYLSCGLMICLGSILFAKDITYLGREFFGVLIIIFGFVVMTMNAVKVVSAVMVYFKDMRKSEDSIGRKTAIFLLASSISICTFYVLNGMVAAQVSVKVG
jgi:hypothetical protein